MGFEAFLMFSAMALWASFSTNGVADTAERVDGLELRFDRDSCPSAKLIVKLKARTSMVGDPSTAAALLRLAFHDCQVDFFSGRVLTETLSEKNFGIRKFDTIDEIKSSLKSAHTLGVGHCRNFESRLRPRADPAISPSHAFVLKIICSSPSVSAITSFDNRYFIDTLNGRGLLKIDSEISRDPRTLPHVVRFGRSLEQFFERFSYGFFKLSNQRFWQETRERLRGSAQ